jgi:glycosyltransferase involved in cell wall biosynthesis
VRRAVFAIPGDLDTVTGGYLYEKRLLEGLRAVGTDTAHLRLGGSFPDPSPADHAHAVRALEAIDPQTPIILDGFVFGSMEPAGLAGLRAPFVGMVHHPLALEEGLSEARRAHLLRTERANVALAAAILVPSPHTARILVEEYDADPARVTVARPGTDMAVGGREPSDPPLILSIGIQHPRKGHDVLLRALARMTDLPWNAVVVGAEWDAAHAADLRALRDGLGLAGRVRLAGLVSAQERDALYRSASVFALATRYEGYGLVFDEALSWGLPVVSCRTGAVPDTVPSDAGILVPPEDPLAFADALRSVLGDPRRRAALAAAASVAGARLPGWLDTARTAQAVLDRLA